MIQKVIRVLVVDDSILFRTKLQLSLSEDQSIKVVGVAANADEAMRRIAELHPDVVTLDVEMPKMSGIEFLKKLIPRNPVPVIVVSSLPMNALDALDAGAVDYVRKPSATEPHALRNFFEELRSKIKVGAAAKVQKNHVAMAQPTLISRLASAPLHVSRDVVIAIGASTGGTEAIISVVKNLPKSTPGIVITQHMPAGFTALYADRLNKICQMSCKEAADRDRVVPGQIILAAGENQMTLHKDAQGYYVRSQPGARVNGHCPSVDVLFNSVCESAGKNAIGVILTGMGADGARGLLKMRQKGSYTIGQDRGSCVVYGMPMEAFKMGAVTKQLPLEQIGDELILYLRQKK